MKSKTLFNCIVIAILLIIANYSAYTQDSIWRTSGNTIGSSTPKLGSLDKKPVKLYTDNKARITILGNGKVGIGTTSPTEMLDIKGNQHLHGSLYLNNGSSTVQFPSIDSAGAPMISMFSSGTQNKERMVIAHSPSYTTWGLQYVDSVDKFNFISSGFPVMTTDLGSRRVGFGTSTPVNRVDIAGTGIYNLETSEGDLRLGNSSYRLKMGVALSGGGAGDAYISSSHRLYLGTSVNFGNTQTVSINSNGRVGIATFNPAGRLDVIGDTGISIPVIRATNAYTGNADVRGIQSYSKPADGYGYGIEATGGYRGGYLVGAGGAYAGTTYGVYATSTGSAGSRIGVYGHASGSGTGNRYGVYGVASGGENTWGGYFPTKTYTTEIRVGGTKGASGYVAAINGRLIATEIRVESLAAWPDYVFAEKYNLTPLEELEKKINSEKHLPGIPSAEEVAKSGIMLGEMQSKTIEKVEELTLYIIQLNKRINELEKKLEEVNQHK